MAKGVKKIKLAKGVYVKGSYNPKRSITLLADKSVEFNVSEWIPGTTKADVTKGITWIWQDHDRKKIIKEFHTDCYGNAKVTISKKLSGTYYYYLEASLGGKRDPNLVGLYINAYSHPRIVSSKWCTTNDGSDQRSKQFKYGNLIYLGLDTEGLNGSKSLTVEVYKVIKGGGGSADDKLVSTYSSVEVNDGEINVKMGNTSTWFIHAKKDVEEFYVKVKNNRGQYISDGKDTIHARFLRIKKEQTTKAVEPSTNNTAVKTGETEKKPAKPIACKYPLINIISGGATKTIFDENNKKPVTVNYPIIASDYDSHKENIILDLKGIKTSQCINSGKPNSHVNKTISVINKPENFIIKSKTEGKLEMLTGFKYHPSNDNLAEKTSFNIIEYIWPISLPADNSKSLEIKTSTCAYTNNVNILVYPDVKWELRFEFGSDLAMEERYTNMKPGAQTKSHNKSAQKTGLNRYKLSSTGKSEVYFGLILKATWDRKTKPNELELTERYLQIIRNFLDVFVKIKEWADEASNLNKTKGTLAERLLKGVTRKPVTLKFYYPTMSIAGSWWLDYSSTNSNKIETKGAIKIGFTPLIKAEGILDLLFYAELIPVAGQVIKVLDVGAKVAGVDIIFSLAAFGEINLTTEFHDFNFEKATLDLKGKLGLRLELSVKASGTMYAIFFEADYKLEASGQAESYVEPRATIGKDNNGVYIEHQTDFSGLRIILIVKAQFGKSKTQIKKTFTIIAYTPKITYGKTYIIK